MSENPNPEMFSANERPREYEVRFDVTGTVEITVEADSIEEARQKAEAMAENEDFGIELDAADYVCIGSVRKSPKMYRIIRDGRPMQSSYLQYGDTPRDPDERGF